MPYRLSFGYDCCLIPAFPVRAVLVGYTRYKDSLIWRRTENVPRKLKRGKKVSCSWGQQKTIKVTETFQAVMKIPLFIGECVGLNPFPTKFGRRGQQLRNKLISWKMLYSIVMCVLQAIATILSMNLQYSRGWDYKFMAYIFFNAITTATTVNFIQVSFKWEPLCKHVEFSEIIDPIKTKGLKTKCGAISILIFILALTEHILSFLQRYAEVLDCFPGDDNYKSYIVKAFPYVFENGISYSLTVGVFLQIFTVLSTIVWNYPDIFIICVSLYLTTRLNQVNQKVAAEHGKECSQAFWKNSREDYNRVIDLVRAFDDVISGVTFTSFSANLIFVCLQLFNSLKFGVQHNVPVGMCPNFPSGPLGGKESSVYFLFSLGFLIARSLAVSLIAAGVHSATKVAGPVLYAVPSSSYNVEVQRFLDEVQGNTVALTGLKFFYVTKGVLLSVAGSIVTYELVLLQFGSVNNTN